MTRRRLILPTLAGAALLAAGAFGVQQASAHHAFAAEFDGKTPVLLRGKVTKVEWINPHAWVHLNAVTPGGTQEWMVEGGTPNTLLRSGIDRNSLKVGTEIVVRGYQSKDKACTPVCKANGRDVTFPDGRKLFMGSSGTGAPKDGSDPNDK
ncbi:hypothetical protein DJ021_12235 [Phenylobacterium hankyongense]|uniref:Uncharacterized protein n=1 Tax=Phenylobacterium hankyongense TaxID=1813876 RepID=A0A328B3M2_9CAUL|nr:DUF6152 family protein [Phenylobacterium hankyongense]RAK60516.1 hypothetical protein DJ021_12235 [Phenylobacterium hankyongense]